MRVMVWNVWWRFGGNWREREESIHATLEAYRPDVLGLIESWIGGFFEITWQEGAVFVIMIVVLLLRPDGLFKRGGMRVG